MQAPVSMGLRVGPLCVLLMLAGLAGCIDRDDPPDPDTPAPTAPPDDAQATLQGTVFNSNLEPIEGAMVIVTRGAQLIHETATDEQGRFQVPRIRAAWYQVQILHECCKNHVDDVQVENTRQYDVTLELLPSLTPHVERLEWTGFIACGVSAAASVTHNCTDPNHDTIHYFKAHEGLRSLVVAMDWDSAGTGLSEDTQLELNLHRRINPQNTYKYESVAGSAPLEIHVNSTGHGDHNFTNIEEEPWDIRIQVRAAGDLNLFYQQPFTVWYHLYQWKEADPDADALPDT